MQKDETAPLPPPAGKQPSPPCRASALAVQAQGPSWSPDGPESKRPPLLDHLHVGILCFSGWGTCVPPATDSVAQSCEPFPKPHCASEVDTAPCQLPSPEQGVTWGLHSYPGLYSVPTTGSRFNYILRGQKSNITHKNQLLSQTNPTRDRGFSSTSSLLLQADNGD